MRLAVGLVIAQRRVGAANEDGKVAALLPCAWAHRVTGPAFYCEVARFQVKEQSGAGFEGPQLRGFADAAFADEYAFDATAFGQPLVSGDDGKAHLFSP